MAMRTLARIALASLVMSGTLEAQTPSAASPLSRTDSVRIREGVSARILAFVDGWRDAWMNWSTQARADTGAEHQTGSSGARQKRVSRPLPWTFGPIAMSTAYNRCMGDDFPWKHMG